MKKMMKMIGFVFLLLTMSITSVAADENRDRFVDDADLVSSNQESDLENQLDEISEKYEFDFVVVTVDSLGGKTPTAYADDFFDYNGYGYGPNYDGALLLVAMDSRDVYISTTGAGITYISDREIDYILDEVVAYLAEEYYAEAFEKFIDETEDALNSSNSTVSTSGDSSGFDTQTFLIVLGAAALTTAVVMFLLVGQLKSVRMQPDARNYVKDNSFVLNVERDQFLYRTVKRSAKPKQNSSSSHRGSSGRSHGGGGRKF